MFNQVANRTRISSGDIIAMRESGASLEQIAETIGRTKERVRQILVKNIGTTRHNLLSTQQLYRQLGLPRTRVVELYKDGIITPKAEWKTGNHHYLLWSPNVAEIVTNYYNKNRLCKMCLKPLGKGRWVFCSDECYREGQKYKYKSGEAKRRHLENIKGYLERRRNRKTYFIESVPV
ncbi:MAG: hypothetical protein JW967_05370 [Dehalococcoidales bacterium]|nr:hypothetical protein [Dehalococcoidales bacterium]